MLTPYGESNPYQRLLVEHLRALGHDVRTGNAAGSFALLRLALSGPWPDVLHLHWIQPFVISRTAFAIAWIKAPLAMFELALLRLLRVRIVWTVHELHHHENPHPRWDAVFNRLTARLAHHAITHCEAAARETREVFDRIPLPVAVMPLPNYHEAYSQPVPRDAARQALDLPASAFVILHLGLIRPYKGVEELLDAFEKIATGNERLVIAGDVPDPALRSTLRRRANAIYGVTLIDSYVPDRDIPTYLGAADLMALPFRAVVNSSSVVLAMTFGLPVLASGLGCVPETLGTGGGFLYDASDPNGLVTALRTALARRTELPGMGERNRRQAAAWDWASAAARTAEVYRKS